VNSTRELAVKVTIVDVNTQEVLSQSMKLVNKRAGLVIRPAHIVAASKEATETAMKATRVAEQLTPWVKGEDIPHRKTSE
jgi:hypothetical protein